MVCMVFTSTCLLISSECRFHLLTSSPQILRTDELTAVALVYCVCVRQRERERVCTCVLRACISCVCVCVFKCMFCTIHVSVCKSVQAHVCMPAH